jgi:bacterioferritin (cytochrome b1)
VKRLAEKHPDKVIDLLNERLAFERSSVRIYDRILEVMRAAGDPQVLGMLDTMRQHRDEEVEHAEWLEEHIQALGGDVHRETELARLALREAQGFEEVVLGSSPELLHLFHALQAAELVDTAGWELLVELAHKADDDAALDAFELRLTEEEDHLEYIRRVIARYTGSRVLGGALRLPTDL